MANLVAVMSNHRLKTQQLQPRLLLWLQQPLPLHTVVVAVGCAGDDGDALASTQYPQPNEVAGRVVPVVTKRGDGQDVS